MTAQSQTNPKVRCAYDGIVVRRTQICREHLHLVIAARGFPASQPGQFLQLTCAASLSTDPHDEVREWPADGWPQLCSAEVREPAAYLRRPFSIADRWEDAGGVTHLEIISRTVGRGTRWLETVQPHDTLNLTGPLGNGFRLPSAPRPLILIGGGVGIPPLFYLARALHAAGHTDVTFIFGALQADLLPVIRTGTPAADGTPTHCVQLPDAAPYAGIITTDDGSLGYRGRVTDALRTWCADRQPFDAPPLVCACGPDAMLRAVASVTRAHGMDCQLCIERNMGCGLGTCLSCVVRAHDAAASAGWRWQLTCKDGPVFDRDALLDYADPATTVPPKE